jgi:hypothetical protein
VRVLDDRHRLFGLINPFDLIVLLAIVVGAGAVANTLFGSSDTDTGATEAVRFRLACGGIEGFDPAWIEPGDAVTVTGGGVIGTVVSVETTPTPVEVLDEAGSAVVVPSALKETVSIEVEGQATRDGYSFVFSGVRLLNNVVYPVTIGAFACDKAQVRGLSADR